MLSRVLAIAVLTGFVAGCGQGSSPSPTGPSPTPSPSSSTVSIVSGASSKGAGAYSPNPITIATGMTVTWMNNDSITHTSTSDTNAWDSGNIAAGGSFSHTFSSAGTFTYHCMIHPGMTGTVTVH